MGPDVMQDKPNQRFLIVNLKFVQLSQTLNLL
uniref:Uncharacterized protein n=1 Tax=Tetranychus urticae TaxID=32264 RepID=T1JT61_TETUR